MKPVNPGYSTNKMVKTFYKWGKSGGWKLKSPGTLDFTGFLTINHGVFETFHT
jgi:hypothetical protein